MPKREDEFWAAQKEPERTKYCPKCGSSNISYNEKFQSWRCNSCEHSFNVPSFESKSEPRPKIPWNDEWFKVKSENEGHAAEATEEKLKLEEIEEECEETEKEYPEIKIDDKTNSKSKAWFGNEYFDEKKRKWKKPRIKTRTIIASVIALILVAIIILLILLYIFIWAKSAS